MCIWIARTEIVPDKLKKFMNPAMLDRKIFGNLRVTRDARPSRNGQPGTTYAKQSCTHYSRMLRCGQTAKYQECHAESKAWINVVVVLSPSDFLRLIR